jgi:hypothetical protein
MFKDLTKTTTPGPSLKKGGEPYPAAPLTGKQAVPIQLLLGTTLFPDSAADGHGSPPSFKEGTGVVLLSGSRIIPGLTILFPDSFTHEPLHH